MNRCAIGVLVVAWLAAFLPGVVLAEFQVFDATLYGDKPSLQAYGIRPLRVVYEAEMWETFKKDSTLPDQSRVREIAARLFTGDIPVVIDIEHWQLTGNDENVVRDSLARYSQVLARFRESAPGVKFGFYGHPPIPDYWRAMDGRGKNESLLWKAENDRIQALADAVDALFPSLYTFYRDRDGWVKYARAQIAEARRLGKGKPVYVFLWPQYHESNHFLGLDYIPQDYWQLDLETARKYADGIVIWGGYRQKWDENAPWWTVTKRFMRNIRAAAAPE
jgi:hypothetical protein